MTHRALVDQFRRLLLVLPVEAAVALPFYVVLRKTVKFSTDSGPFRHRQFDVRIEPKRSLWNTLQCPSGRRRLAAAAQPR